MTRLNYSYAPNVAILPATTTKSVQNWQLHQNFHLKPLLILASVPLLVVRLERRNSGAKCLMLLSYWYELIVLVAQSDVSKVENYTISEKPWYWIGSSSSRYRPENEVGRQYRLSFLWTVWAGGAARKIEEGSKEFLNFKQTLSDFRVAASLKINNIYRSGVSISHFQMTRRVPCLMKSPHFKTLPMYILDWKVHYVFSKLMWRSSMQ